MFLLEHETKKIKKLASKTCNNVTFFKILFASTCSVSKSYHVYTSKIQGSPVIDGILH